MSPPVYAFPPSALDAAIQANVVGRRRKVNAPGNPAIELAQCELKEMLQYRCGLQNSGSGSAWERSSRRGQRIMCVEVQRWFRRCEDRKGSFMVETTTWETEGTLEEGFRRIAAGTKGMAKEGKS